MSGKSGRLTAGGLTALRAASGACAKVVATDRTRRLSHAATREPISPPLPPCKGWRDAENHGNRGKGHGNGDPAIVAARGIIDRPRLPLPREAKRCGRVRREARKARADRVARPLHPSPSRRGSHLAEKRPWTRLADCVLVTSDPERATAAQRQPLTAVILVVQNPLPPGLQFNPCVVAPRPQDAHRHAHHQRSSRAEHQQPVGDASHRQALYHAVRRCRNGREKGVRVRRQSR